MSNDNSGTSGQNHGTNKKRRVIPRRPFQRKWTNSEDYEEVFQHHDYVKCNLWRAREKRTADLVIVQRVPMENEINGVPQWAIRELANHRIVRHENIQALKGVITGKKLYCSNPRPNQFEMYFVFENFRHVLSDMMLNPSICISEGQTKKYIRQLLKGLDCCHKNGVIHRNITSSNLLIDDDDVLKISGFGLSRAINDMPRYTNPINDLQYRAPEVILGSNAYGPEIDIWAAGCLLVELLNKRPLFNGTGDILHVNQIFRAVGSPTARSWPGWEKLPLAHMIIGGLYPGNIAQQLGHLPPLAVKLIQSLLCLDPKGRVNALDALHHEWLMPDVVIVDS